jgi:hypothetical protein
MLQAGPKTSAFVVTPVLSAFDAVAGAAADSGAAAGALVAALLELVPVLPQAARATVSVAIAPSVASRWNFRTGFPFERCPVDPGFSSELSGSRRLRFDVPATNLFLAREISRGQISGDGEDGGGPG